MLLIAAPIHHCASITLFHPQGQVLGISNDYPKIKVFEPAASIKK